MPYPDSDLSLAPLPFNKCTADVILASSDNVAFRVHSQILSEASGFFEDVFSVPKPSLSRQLHPSVDTSDNTQPLYDGLSLLHVSEDSQTLEHLLRFCYPMQDPSLPTVEELDLVLEAAIKYDMPEATRVLMDRLRGFVQVAPLAVYCVACRHDFEDIASTAAEEVCHQDLQDTHVPQLRQISVGCYNRLLRFHENWRPTPGTDRRYLSPAPPFSFTREPRPSSLSSLSEATGGPDMTPETLPETPVPGSPDVIDLPPAQAPSNASFTYSMRHSDVILRSCDGNDFPVHEDVIVPASSCLERRVRNARAKGDGGDAGETLVTEVGKVVVLLEENNQTLSLLLQIIYPVGLPLREGFEVICEALSLPASIK
ncbi:hypothetical protein OBBRIDRAFT_523082 [Obba rivulosa]|uniref:BTB domain-containing protein n=1 Tax=Obba rivulosa TaxID=1052685 RepID=A0A8E2B0C6_9APHY|nr:hypothetical protein OBBRIDRAFT_523082 [Obba rivulosa]